MNDKSVGIIGQKYEDRKTGKSGVLESRDDKYKTMMFRADDGTTFNVSNSSFRSNWRKVKSEDETATEEPAENNAEAVSEPEASSDAEIPATTEEPDETSDEAEETHDEEPADKDGEDEPEEFNEYTGMTDEAATELFVDHVSAVRQCSVSTVEGQVEIVVDNLVVLRARHAENGTFGLAMLPDIFTFSNWKGLVNVASIQYKLGAEDHLGVIFDTKQTELPELFRIIEDAVKDINLYGYTIEPDESDENEESEENEDA